MTLLTVLALALSRHFGDVGISKHITGTRTRRSTPPLYLHCYSTVCSYKLYNPSKRRKKWRGAGRVKHQMYAKLLSFRREGAQSWLFIIRNTTFHRRRRHRDRRHNWWALWTEATVVHGFTKDVYVKLSSQKIFSHKSFQCTPRFWTLQKVTVGRTNLRGHLHG